MYEGFGTEWFVSAVAFFAIFKWVGELGAGFWGFVGIVVLALILGGISAASLMLLPILRLPVNYLTAILVLLATNAFTLLLAEALTPLNVKDGLWAVVGWSLIIAIVRSLLRGIIDRFSEN